ncbi:23S rRNA (cytidine1920-2'-O)/16S rRNA (cytidine1409-2'-O)-methyltransferase [Desulfonauticus submarinus]|uniref:23S rRNA (Cytidine1920-2'-O)/16S rRNA (Cytidine1409-2'-O)-methyltransferase n=1 Tax=Desulfonauticus submarinus TaxID=206665 RepID=A0A1H0BU76_9BACT|nr:TlyA family RNA methyltransferase [Desulfonauticus submarinus]SDN49143.1 23S rRNA (cytidine1920-2'-O)/16S rRNA (cytidine1409-2'-O)-methyltransferase [Desulfonauticus submarinus]
MKKKRADQLLVEKGVLSSREKAKRHIMAGVVWYLKGKEWQKVNKPGDQLPLDTDFKVKEKERFVSRGGYKLLTALEYFKIQVLNKVCLDVGASTGGFTDCLLQFGAKRVYALDVGQGQLDWKLRQDKRVVNLEKINIRYASLDILPELVDLIVVDCSFISLKLVLPSCIKFLKSQGEVIALVKPQFEVGKGETVKGVVKSAQKIQEVLKAMEIFVTKDLKLRWIGMVPSKIKGPKGNQEYLIYLQR